MFFPSSFEALRCADDLSVEARPVFSCKLIALIEDLGNRSIDIAALRRDNERLRRINLISILSDEIGMVQPSPAVWVCLAHRTLQPYRDASARQVSEAEVAAGGKMGPAYIYRHPLLLR